MMHLKDRLEHKKVQKPTATVQGSRRVSIQSNIKTSSRPSTATISSHYRLQPPYQRSLPILNEYQTINVSASSQKIRDFSSSPQNSSRKHIQFLSAKSLLNTIKAPPKLFTLKGENYNSNKNVEKCDTQQDTRTSLNSNRVYSNVQLKYKSLNEIRKIESFIDDQKDKILQAYKVKKALQMKGQKQQYDYNVLQQSPQNQTADNMRGSSYCSDNSIRSLNEIDEIEEGFETTKSNVEKNEDCQQKELIKLIFSLERQRNQNRTLEEIRDLQDNKIHTQRLRKKQPHLQYQLLSSDKDTLKITFSRHEVSFRTILREIFSKHAYTNIDIKFENEEVQLTDCVLFEQQLNSLRNLQLTFVNADNFNEETLGAIKYIKLRNLQNLVLNFVRSKPNKHIINYSLFTLSYIPRIEINFSQNDQLLYIKDDVIIPIDFSSFDIPIQDVQKLNQYLIEFSSRSIHLILNDNPHLSSSPSPLEVHSVNTLEGGKTKLQEIGKILSNLSELKISLKNCSLKEGDIHDLMTGLMGTVQNDKRTNSSIEILEINIEGNNQIQESFFKTFKQSNFKTLQSLTLIFDKMNQILNQYEEFNAFNFIKHLKHINHLRLITNCSQVIYEHTLSLRKCSLSISSLEISPFQLVDILKVLNMSRNILDLSLDLSNNYKLTYSTFFKFLTQLRCFQSNVKKLFINLTNTNVSALELVCLCLSFSHIKNVVVKYDVEISSLLRVTDSYSQLYLVHLGETIVDPISFQTKFIYILSSLSVNPYFFSTIAIHFYYNYSLTPQLFDVHFKPFLQTHRELTNLHLDFNYCCFESSQILSILRTVLDGLQQKQFQRKVFQKIKLCFLNNHQVQLKQLLAVFKAFLIAIPLLKSLILITDEFVLEKVDTNGVVFCGLNICEGRIKINKMKEVKLVQKKLYVVERGQTNYERENIGDDEDSLIVVNKQQDFIAPPRVKKVIQQSTESLQIIRYDENNPKLSLESLTKTVQDFAKRCQENTFLIVCGAHGTELECNHSRIQQLIK